MYAQEPGELEMILLTAMECWQLASGSPGDQDRDLVRRWWRDEVEAACEAAGVANKSVARLSDLIPEEPLGRWTREKRTLKHLRRVWRKLSSPVDLLGAVKPPDG